MPSGEAEPRDKVHMRTAVAARDKRKALEQIVLDLGRLQGIAKTAEESFVAFLIASAQREAGSRANELMEQPTAEPAE
jgi:hypothetical protein